MSALPISLEARRAARASVPAPRATPEAIEAARAVIGPLDLTDPARAIPRRHAVTYRWDRDGRTAGAHHATNHTGPGLCEHCGTVSLSLVRPPAPGCPCLCHVPQPITKDRTR